MSSLAEVKQCVQSLSAVAILLRIHNKLTDSLIPYTISCAAFTPPALRSASGQHLSRQSSTGLSRHSSIRGHLGSHTSQQALPTSAS